MKSFLKLIKEKKLLVIGVAVVIVLAIVVIAVSCSRKSEDNVKKPYSSQTVVHTDKNGKVIKKDNKEKASDAADKKKEKADKKKEQKKKEKAWGDVVVVEEGTKSKKDKEVLYKRNKKGEIVTNKKGEKITRKASYPGEDDGWSPIVNPDDLKKK